MDNYSIHTIVPQLRFPEFANDGDWEVAKVGDVIKTITPPKKINSSEYKKSGKYPIIDQSQSFICGYSDDDDALMNHNNEDLIVFGDHTCVLKFVSFPFIQGADGIKIIKSKDSNKLVESFLFQSLLNNPVVSREYKRHFSELKEKEFCFSHRIAEQRKIASCLFSMDEYISATKEKLELLKTYKKGLMQKLFPAKGKKQPELRFKEFEKDGEWEVKKLGEVTKDVNRRNKSNRNLPIYSISNKDGFILQSEQFDGLDSVSRGYDTSLYKIVTSNTFAYNPARINVGSIGYSGTIKECLISSLYVCFKTTEDVDDSFLMYFFDTSSFNQSVENNVEGGIRSYLFYENFSKIKIMFPSISEQKRIVSFLKAIDEIIDALPNKISELERYKIGMMQKMFPIIK